MPLPALRRDNVRQITSQVTSAVPAPPETATKWLSAKLAFCFGPSYRDGMSNGGIPASSDSSATRAARFADRTDPNVATARTSVPPAVANDEIVTQSAAIPSP